MDRSYEVYRYYLALRLHFTTDEYDVIKQRGRIKTSKNAFYKRKDLYSLKKIAESYNEKEVVDFFVANFVTGDRWGGVFDEHARDRYMGWKRKIESLSYIFEKELSVILNTGDGDFNKHLVAETGRHPVLLKMFLRNEISIETLVILNKLTGFVTTLDTSLKDDLLWPDLSRIIKKYDPFLPVEKEKYGKIASRVLGLELDGQRSENS